MPASDAFDALVSARHRDPFAVLGPHVSDGRLVVRAILPSAERVDVVHGHDVRPMARVHAALMESVPSARLLLQVHDELLLDCSIADADEVAARVQSEMVGAAALAWPLEVSFGRGPTWLDPP